MPAPEEITQKLKELHLLSKDLCDYFEGEEISVYMIQNDTTALANRKQELIEKNKVLDQTISDRIKDLDKEIENTKIICADMKKKADEEYSFALRDREAARQELEEAKKKANLMYKEAKLKIAS